MNAFDLLNPRRMLELTIAFANVLNPNKIKEGEIMLEKLREDTLYPLMISNFISQNKNRDQEMFALLELSKLTPLKDENIYWALAQRYYCCSDKIARHILEITTKVDNVYYIGAFFKSSSCYEGMLGVSRLLTVYLEILKYQSKSEIIFQNYKSEVLNTFLKIIVFKEESYEIRELIAICFTFILFRCKELKINCYEFIDNFMSQNEEEKINETPIEHIFFSKTELKNKEIEDFYNQIFSGLFINKISEIFYAEALHLYEHLYNRDAIRELIIFCKCFYFNLRNYFELTNKMKEELSEEEEISEPLEWRVILYSTTLLVECESKSLLKNLSNEEIFHLIALGLYVELPHLYINELFELKVKNHFDWLHSMMIENVSLKDLDCFNTILMLQFVGKYYLRVCPNDIFVTARIVDELALSCLSIAHFCYDLLGKINDIFITFLPQPDLIFFLETHLHNINANEWGHSPIGYTCALKIIIFLEETNNYITKSEIDSIVRIETLKAISILINLMEEEEKMDHEIFTSIVEILLWFLFKNNSSVNRKDLFVLSKIIHKQCIYSRETAKIYALFIYREKIHHKAKLHDEEEDNRHDEILKRIISESRNKEEKIFNIQVKIQYLFLIQQEISQSLTKYFVNELYNNIKETCFEDYRELIADEDKSIWESLESKHLIIE